MAQPNPPKSVKVRRALAAIGKMQDRRGVTVSDLKRYLHCDISRKELEKLSGTCETLNRKGLASKDGKHFKLSAVGGTFAEEYSQLCSKVNYYKDDLLESLDTEPEKDSSDEELSDEEKSDAQEDEDKNQNVRILSSKNVNVGLGSSGLGNIADGIEESDAIVQHKDNLNEIEMEANATQSVCISESENINIGAFSSGLGNIMSEEPDIKKARKNNTSDDSDDDSD